MGLVDVAARFLIAGVTRSWGSAAAEVHVSYDCFWWQKKKWLKQVVMETSAKRWNWGSVFDLKPPVEFCPSASHCLTLSRKKWQQWCFHNYKKCFVSCLAVEHQIRFIKKFCFSFAKVPLQTSSIVRLVKWVKAPLEFPSCDPFDCWGRDFFIHATSAEPIGQVQHERQVRSGHLQTRAGDNEP